MREWVETHQTLIAAKVFLLAVLYFPFLRNITGSPTTAQILLNSLLALLGLVGVLLAVPRSRAFLVPGLTLFYLAVAWVIAILSSYFEASLARAASDVGRLLLAALFLGIGYQLAASRSITEYWVSRQILIYAVAGVVFSAFVAFEFAWPLVDLYKGRLSDDPMQFHFRRASGFSAFPTDFGCFLVLALLLVRALRRRGMLGWWGTIALSATFLVGIAASAARGAIAQLVGVAMVLTGAWLLSTLDPMSWIRKRFHVSKITAVTLVAIGAAASVGALFATGRISITEQQAQSFSYVAEALTNPDASVIHRFIELRYSLEIIRGDRPIPAGRERQSVYGLEVVESYWAHYVLRYGLLGFVTALVIGSVLIAETWRTRRSPLGEAVVLWLLTFFFFVAPFSDVMTRARGIALYFTLIGFCLGWHYMRRQSRPSSDVAPLVVATRPS